MICFALSKVISSDFNEISLPILSANIEWLIPSHPEKFNFNVSIEVFDYSFSLLLVAWGLFEFDSNIPSRNDFMCEAFNEQLAKLIERELILERECPSDFSHASCEDYFSSWGFPESVTEMDFGLYFSSWISRFSMSIRVRFWNRLSSMGISAFSLE